MKKKLSAALLSFMLVFQVMSSGYLAPFTALANEAPTTQLNDEETPQPKERTAEEIAAAEKALAEATEAVNSLFADADHKNIVEGLDEYRITTVQAIVNKLEDGDDKTKLDELVTKASLLIATKDEEKVEADKEVPATTEKEEETTAPKEDVKKEDVKKEEVKKEEKPAKAPKKLKAKEAGTDITSKVEFTNIKMKVNGKDVSPGTNIELSELENNSADLTFSYSLPNGAGFKAGDYFTFQLPPALKMYSAVKGELIDKSEKVFGTYSVDMEGTVKAIFNEEISNLGNIKGEFGFESELIVDETQTNEQTVTITPIVGGTSFDFKFIFPKPDLPNKNPLDKEGKWKGVYNQKAADWTIYANQRGEKLTKGTVEDVLPEGMNLVAGTVKIEEYKVLVDGKLAQVEPTKATSSYTEDSRKLIVNLGETENVFKISYQTEIQGAVKEKYSNSAALLDGGISKGKDTKTLPERTVGKTLEKNFKGFSKDNKHLNWEVRFNGKSIEYPAGTELKDNLIMADTKVSILKVIINEETGDWAEGSDYEGVEVSVGTIKFNEKLTEPVIIKYSTPVPDNAENGKDITNTVTINGTSESKTATAPIPPVGLTKIYSDENAEDHTVKWSITANAGKASLKTGSVITDTLPEDLTLEGKVEVLEGGEVLSEDKYEFTQEGNVLKVTINKETSKAITVNFKTNYIVNDSGSGSEKLYSYLNKASYSYTNVYGNSKEITASKTFEPKEETQLNGYKKGVFDKKTKQVNWEIAVNSNNQEISKAIIKDTLEPTDGFTIVEGSFQVKEDSLKEGSLEPKDYTLKLGQDKKSFTLTFNKIIKKKHIITYSTIDDDKIYSGNYTNTAKLYNDEDVLTTLIETVGTKDSNGNDTNFGKYIEKNGSFDPNRPDIFKWNLTVNQAESKLSNFTITDKPKGIQTLKENTVKIAEVAGNTSLDKGTDYSVTVNKETGEFKIKFLKEITKSYIVTYETIFVPEEKTGSLSNEAKVSADGITIENHTSSKPVEYRSSKAWGTASGNIATLQVTKTYNDGEVNTAGPTAGIKFGLFADKNGTNKIDEAETDENGVAKFYRVHAQKEYYLKELNTPENYVEQGLVKVELAKIDPANVVEAALEETVKDLNYKYENKAKVRAVNLKKTGKDNKALAGVVFELKKDGIEFTYDNKTEFTTDTNGEIYLGNKNTSDLGNALEVGKYQFIEKSSIDGYKVDKTPIEFTITDNNDKAVEVSMANKACDHVSMIIKDKTGKVIANAKVTAVNSETDIGYTDSEGKVTFEIGKIIPGTTQLVIEKSGYNWKEKVTIDLNAKVIDCQLDMEIKVDAPANACKDVTFTIKNGEALAKAGTKVTIIDQNGNKEIVKDGKLKDGVITVSLKELTSTSGYTIKVSQEGSKTVTFTNQFIYDCKVELDVKEAAACKTTVVTVNDGENVVANAKVTTLINGKTVSMFTDAQGQVTFNTALAKDSKISISKSGYEVKESTVGDYVYDCALEVTLTELIACDDVTFTIKNGEALAKAGTKVTIIDQNGNKEIVKDGKLKDGVITVSLKELTSTSGYTIKVSQEGSETVTFEDQFIYDCKVELDVKEAAACKTTVVTVKDGENAVANAKVTTVIGEETVSMITDAKGQVTFKTALAKDSKILISKSGYKVEESTVGDYVYDCALEVTLTELTACKDVTFTIKNGKDFVKAGTKVIITDKAEPNNTITYIVTKEDVLAGNFKISNLVPTSTSGYTIEVRETGKKPKFFEEFIYNCEVNLDMASAEACDNITVTFDTKDDSEIKLSENKVYVVNEQGIKQDLDKEGTKSLNLDKENKVTIPTKFATGEYKIVLVQDGKANFVTKIESDDCKQTITVTEESTNGNTCPATTITVKNGSEVIEGAKVVITKTEAGEEATVLFTGTTDEKGKITTTEYLNLSDKEIKVYVKGYNTKAAIKVSDENCEAVVDLNKDACSDYAIKAVDQDGKVITNNDFLEGSEFKIIGDKNEITNVKINIEGELVNKEGKVLSIKELTASKTAEYTLVQTKTAPGFKKLDDQKVQDLDNCTGLVTINLNKTNDLENPGASCPDFSVIYKGPENSTAEFKLVKVEKKTGADGNEVVTEKEIEENIKVKTDEATKTSSLDLKTKSFVEGTYKLVQTKAHPGYFNAQSKEFKVTEGICVVGLKVTNSPVPPPACAEDMYISVTDTDGKKVSTDNAKVTVDGNETPVTTADGTVIIPKDLLDSAKESTIIITLEDGRTTTVVLPKDRVECTANAKVPVLKVCEENPTITVKDKNGKDVPTDKIVKVTVNGKEVTPIIENGKVVIPKDSVNPKVDSVVTVTTKGGEEGTVTIPKFSENCDYTIVINNTCDALTVNVTENGKKAENGTVSIIDQNGKVVATQKVTENGKVTFPAKYVDSSYSVKVTIGKVTQLGPVNANENCEVIVNVKTIACEKATIHVTLDGKPVSGATVITLDKKGKEIDVDATDKKGNVSIDPIYANKDHKFEVTVEEESKVVEFTGCDISIGFKTKPVVDGDTEEPNKPGKPDQPEKPTTPPTKPEKPTTPPTKPTTPPTTVDGDSEENAGNHTVKPNNKYDIYDENGNLIHHNAGVDKNGQLEVGKLPAGTYTFVNDKGEKVTVKVGKDGQLPQTGSDQTMLFGLAGVALLGAGLFLIGRNRKRNA